jgi:hypothetical protein
VSNLAIGGHDLPGAIKEEMTMQIKLTRIERGVFNAAIAGRKSVVVLVERNRAKADFKENAITIPTARLRAGLNASSEGKVPLFVAVEVSVAGRWNNSIIVTHDTFKAIKSGHSDFGLGAKARAIFEKASGTIEGAKFEIVEQAKAAAQQSTAKKAEAAKAA